MFKDRFEVTYDNGEIVSITPIGEVVDPIPGTPCTYDGPIPF